jgi:stage II sporulation protein M
MPESSARPQILAVVLLFAASAAAGFLVPAPGSVRTFEELRTLLAPYGALPAGRMFLFILANNALKSFAVLAGGVLFGILPLLAAAANGYFLGLSILYASGRAGYGKALLLLLPHGIFEIPAILLAAGYGLWLGMSFSRRLLGREPRAPRGDFRRAVRTYFRVILPLLIVAAFLETLLIHLVKTGASGG